MTDETSARSDPRAEPFGYICGRCSNCCRDKIIQLNPYEVARLAANRGTSTTEFREKWTENGAGTYLRRTETGACVFLGAEGCTVHPDRPLVCRLYPLGRQVSVDGRELFRRAVPHPDTMGTYSTDGTIADFLQVQGAEPFMTAADDYLRWFARAHHTLGERTGHDSDSKDPGQDLLDMDVAIAAHCAQTGAVEPADIEERRKMHVRILEIQLNEFEGEFS